MGVWMSCCASISIISSSSLEKTNKVDKDKVWTYFRNLFLYGDDLSVWDVGMKYKIFVDQHLHQIKSSKLPNIRKTTDIPVRCFCINASE